jgi:hypothetical protein
LKRGGNEKKLSPVQLQELLTLRRFQNGLRLAPLTRIFNEQTYAYPGLEGVSPRTTSRNLSRLCVTRKQASVIAKAADPTQQLNWMDGKAWLDPIVVADVDENSASRNKLKNIWAWSACGDEAPILQEDIFLLGYSFSVISAYTYYGFLCWTIYEGTITSLEVEDFLRDELGPLLDPQNFVIVDNATNHGTVRVRRALEDVTGGNWDYAPPYSYNMKPCEKGLSMVVTWARGKTDTCHTKQDVVNLLDEAFYVHSVNGEHSDKAMNHWGQFAENHFAYLEDQIH